MIPFTQFVFPNGRKRQENIDRPPEIESLANELILAGWSFEIECHPDTQIVHLDCCDEDEALSNRVCRNGPQVPIKVDELIKDAHDQWVLKGRTQAIGTRAVRIFGD